MDQKALKRLIDVAMGREAADLCIRNCKVVDVCSRGVFPADVYVDQGVIVGFGGEGFPFARETVDVQGGYLAPGFIDAHVHIESSHVSPAEFSRLVVPHGTTTVVADPHEICNVCGMDGFDYMLSSTQDLPLQVFLQLPSCVPCTPFENAGAILNAPELATHIGLDRVLGLGEMMNYVGVCAGDEGVLEKLLMARKAGKLVDGHSPGLCGAGLDAYIASGVSTDHECTTPEELRERVKRGMYVLLREGTVTKDVLRLLPAVDEHTFRQCAFCTDDRQSADLVMEGHIDNALRVAISHGLDPVTAITMASFNAANCYGLNDRGAIVPGRRADLVLFQDLENLWVDSVWVAGRQVARDGQYLGDAPSVKPKNVSGRMNVKNFSASRLRLPISGDTVRTIRIIPDSVVTESGRAQARPTDEWVRDNRDIVKLAVVERHKGTGNVGVGLLEGFGLRGGAIATSVAHDSHNIIVAGDSDRDMELAVRRLTELGGGMALVKDGVVLDSLAHEIAGLMTDQPGEWVARRLAQLGNRAHEELGIHEWVDPFMTLCFMALPVIPELKITDLGLFDVNKFCHVSVDA